MIKIIPFLYFFSFFISSLYSQTNFKLFHNLNLPLQEYSSDTSSFHMLSVPFISFDLDVYSNPGFQKFFSKENNNLIINLGNYKNNITDFSHHMLDIKNHLLYYAVKSGNTLYSYGLDHSVWMETSFSKDFISLIIDGNKQYLNETITFENNNARLYNYFSIFFGYSKSFNDKITFGTRLKLLKGMSSFGIEDGFFTMSSVDNFSTENTPFATQITTDFNFFINSDSYLLSNIGFAIDFSLQYELSSNISIYTRMLELGCISWREDQYSSNGTYEFHGIDYTLDEDLIDEVNYLYDTIVDIFDIQESNSIKSLRSLPYSVNFGFNYSFDDTKNNQLTLNYELKKLSNSFLHTGSLAYIKHLNNYHLSIIPIYSFNRYNYTNLSLYLNKKWSDIIFTNLYIENTFGFVIKNQAQLGMGLEVMFVF